MDTFRITPQPINANIFDAIDNCCLAQTEELPEIQELLRERDKLIEAIEGISPDAANQLWRLSDLCVELSATFGSEMLKLGIEIGRNPQIAFDIPSE